MRNKILIVWFSGGFGLIALWHLLMALTGITVSFQTLNITLSRELHLIIAITFGLLSFFLYSYGKKKH